jgi:uncharacterized FlaG/YvyC family protein
MVEESDSLGSVGAVASTGHTGTYESVPSTPAVTTTGATPVASVRGKPSQQPSAQSIQDAAREVNNQLAGVNRVLELTIDAGSGLTVATIKNSQTGEVLQQYPGADALHLAQMLADWSHGKNVLLDLMA